MKKYILKKNKMKVNNIIKKILGIGPKPVLSLTTIPTRLVSEYGYDIKYCLESLLNQNYSDYEIHFNIPYVFKKTNEEYVIPEWLETMANENKKLKIFRTEDFGTITKSLPTILRLTDPESIIIVVDDDLVYHNELINEHIKNRKKYPNNPVGYDGMRSRNEDGTFSSHFMDSRDYYYSGNYRDSRVDILQHYKSVSYKRALFGDDFVDFVNEYYHWNDDLIIAAYFASKKVDRFVTYYELDKKCETNEEWLNFVGISFPILKHTQHRNDEGCNIERANNNHTNENRIYEIIDNCYRKN